MNSKSLAQNRSMRAMLLAGVLLPIMGFQQNYAKNENLRIAPQDEEVAIKWTPKKDDAYSYKLSLKMELSFDGESIDVDINAKEQHKVLNVSEDGNVEIEVKYEDTKVVIGGVESNDAASLANSTSTYRPNGSLLSSKSEGDDDDDMRIGNASAFIYPEKDKKLKEGDTWKYSYKADSAKKSYDGEATYTYKGRETVGSNKCFKVECAYKESGAPKDVSSKWTFWIREEDGRIAKQEGTIENAPMDEDITSTIKITSELD